MNLEELEEELERVLPPGFQIEKDSKGQIVILTNLIQDEDGELVSFDGDDEDPDFDPDFEPLDEDADLDDD
jgi:hypothetical protein